MSAPAIIRGRVLLLVRTHARNMCNRFRRKIHRYSDELLNISIKRVIISNIHSQQKFNNRKWLLRTTDRNVCLFSFVWYFVEKPLNFYDDEYQRYTCAIHQFNEFLSVINPAGKRGRADFHLQQPEQPTTKEKIIWGFNASRRNNNRHSLHPIECIKQVNGLHASDGFQSLSKIHHHSDEMMNTDNKCKIIRYIGIHQILITGYLPMNGKCAIQHCFSFGEYFDEKLMSVYAANKQVIIYNSIKSSFHHPSSNRQGNGTGRVSISRSRSSYSRFQRQR